MKKYTLLLIINIICVSVFSQNYPDGVNKLMQAYPDFVIGYDTENILMKDGTKLPFDDGVKNKTYIQLLNNPSISDMFIQTYITGIAPTPIKNQDPGRMRNEQLMKAMYGSTSQEVQKNLTSIIWCPNLVGSKIRITKINGVDKQLQKVSDELDKHPELKKYLTGATTFNWRIISGTNRLSTHSFGTAIDLNVKFSNYWQWDCRCKNEDATLTYKNKIPMKIVEIFEKHGFIWGGKWYHYDTMHFEYRPELLTE